jgi:hypothetical protein
MTMQTLLEVPKKSESHWGIVASGAKALPENKEAIF